MTLDDIKAAVDAGLTDRGGHRLNGKEAEFFIADPAEDAAENPGRQIKIRRAGEGRSTRGRGGTPTQTASRSRGRGIKGKQAF